MLPLLAAAVLVVLFLGYTIYGRFLARQYALDDRRATPATTLADGVDFVPTRPFYLLGQHFSAIAAAGPIAGPIFACQQFGWAPCLLWITFGVVFIGAVHDLSALVASLRHRARSVAEIVKENLGPGAWRALLAFIWIALVYVIVAFADITAGTFVDATQELPDGLSFHPGGAVAFAAVAYLLLALLLGWIQRRCPGAPLWALTLVFVPATLGAVWLGTQASTWLVLPHAAWAVLILAYCFVASLIPVWALLQPRGYLGGFVLYLALGVGTVGVFFGGFEIQAPAFTARPLLGLEGSLFPFLFVTIACGACSGFHGLVCSGTTSKQIARESHCHPVGYGAMLLEAFVAVIALATVMTAAPRAGASPSVVYAEGIARFLAVLTGPGLLVFATTFGAMAFSTFVFDTLDVATRLGRYLLEELFGWRGRSGALLATGLTAGVPLALLLAAGKDGYRTFWVLFGTSNQLLAALTLLGITVWLKREGRRAWFTVAPMLFVMAITGWALVGQVRDAWRKSRDPDGAWQAVPLGNAVVAVLLIGLALYLVVEAWRALRRPLPATPRASA